MPKAWTDLNGMWDFFSWESPFWWNCDLYCLKTKLFSGHFMITFSELYNPTPWWYLIYIQIGVFSYEHFHIHECISISSTYFSHSSSIMYTNNSYSGVYQCYMSRAYSLKMWNTTEELWPLLKILPNTCQGKYHMIQHTLCFLCVLNFYRSARTIKLIKSKRNAPLARSLPALLHLSISSQKQTWWFRAPPTCQKDGNVPKLRDSWCLIFNDYQWSCSSETS